ncbi:chemotaxis response regulator protein-glutamate methylesterase [Oceanispirochaeta sp.]|uniref:protein-glutamate methylesterase/protein-glutamine glutaminase n=1 Tax=Oceanispirochaeta sp. TaxID=2035350 RepID=UPI002604C049|nr:chemotaxis response regulator protein-glutamate methylesterase [Oceanispirochaeta sp.]MDA3955889.1 chemotaxis response regulator protein-glutamate methylesterase [Oceanispirochaeta sp.]
MAIDKIKVLIIDDSAVVRQTLSMIIEDEKDIEVINTAPNPIIGEKKIALQKPDVIILDIEMPQMDGLTFLKKLMSENPIPTIICSSKTEKGGQNAITAIELGAVDIVQKPKVGTKEFLQESKIRICDVIRAAARSNSRVKNHHFKAPVSVAPKLTADAILAKSNRPLSIDTTEMIAVVGASTGGTEALRIFLEMMPINSPGIVIVQHMPEHFTKSFAQRLNSLCKIEVKEAENNDVVYPGRALIAPGNMHILLKRQGARYYVETKDGPLVCRHKPSVDVLFRSAARYSGPNTVGIIMTGMGDDGARGMSEMKEAGAYNIAQDEASCVVFGMPKEAIKRDAVDCILPLNKIAAELIRRTNE